jgi:hypothetical protein
MLHKQILWEWVSGIRATFGFQGFSVIGNVGTALEDRLLRESQGFQRIPDFLKNSRIPFSWKSAKSSSILCALFSFYEIPSIPISHVDIYLFI